MRVTIFGANGRTGQQLVEGALAAGHSVTAFVRDPAKLATGAERLRIVQGDALDAAAVEEAVRGQDAVLVALGHAANSPKDVLTRGTALILAAMQRHDVRRLVGLTGAGVADPNDQPKLLNRLIAGLLRRLQPELLADSERQVALIRASELDWVIVRVPRLTDRPATGRWRVGYVGRDIGPLISRADAAAFMLQHLEDDTWLLKAPAISN